MEEYYMELFPEPRKIVLTNGNYKLNKNTKIVILHDYNQKGLHAARLLKNEIIERTCFNPIITKQFCYEPNNIVLSLVPDLDSEEYNLQISKEGVLIEAGVNGLLYGVQTLRQLVRQKGHCLPYATIMDKPILQNRGLYLDITRGKMPTLKTLKGIVDIIAFYKMNQLQLYIEDSFNFDQIREVWFDKTPITSEEILELDEYCLLNNIELVPSMATFGHLYEILETETYKKLRECEEAGGRNCAWFKKGFHHTLDVTNNQSFELIKKMIDEFAPLFKSEKFNICCDETFDLGKGKSKVLAEKEGIGTIYFDFMKKIIDYVLKYKKEVMFWGDVAIEHKEFVAELPSNIVLLNWEYSPKPDENKIKVIADFGLNQYVCANTQGFEKLVNNTEEAFENINKDICYAEKYNAQGALVTEWGDYGNINTIGASMPSIIYAAGLMWHYSGSDMEKYDKTISLMEYGIHNVVTLLKSISEFKDLNWGIIAYWCYKQNEEIGIAEKNEYGGAYDKMDKLIELDRNILNSNVKKINKIFRDFIEIYPKVYANKRHEISEILISIKGLELSYQLVKVLKDINEGDKSSCIELAEEYESYIYEYADIWRKSNKESELKDLINAVKIIVRYLMQKSK